MDKLIIQGSVKLSGTVETSASKNATLPILTACLLNDEKVTLTKLPKLRDVATTFKLLEMMGAGIEKSDDDATIDCRNLTSTEASYELVKTMRASILVLGPLLARYKKAIVSLPGGCAIGARPIDIHLSGLEKMGAKIELKNGNVEATSEGLKGAHIVLSFPSVGATENIMMAASLADGTTVIENAAREPEIDDLANFINAMGGKVKGIGSSRLEVEGVKKLKSCTYQIIGDRIEAATYVIAGIMTNSEIEVTNIKPNYLTSVLDTLDQMGAKLERLPNSIKVKKHNGLKGAKIETAPYPGFPTDVQAQMMSLMLMADGASFISETIFENRFMHVPELIRMGAQITLKGNSAFIEGGSELTGAKVMCTDLRASAALVLAALVAKGESVVQRVYHLDRGYEKLDQKFSALGVNIKRVNDGT
ncbi:MAG: UDP-N-acetylglucosamine 1-carboxyvinyltransferase [Bacteriovoracaceae bacterium]